MSVTYKKLWKLLIDRNMKRTDLKEASGVSFNVMARMGRDEIVSVESIEKICKAINCSVDDILEFDPVVSKSMEAHK